MGDALTRVYRAGVLEAEGFAIADVSEHLADPETTVWADLSAPSKEQLHELAAELGLHELAVEDALGRHQRPKLDRYASHLFLACQAVRLQPETATLEETEIDVVVDEYFDAVEAFDDYYDEVSDGIFSEHPLDPAQQRQWFEMRQALVRFHRLVVPTREAVSSLMRREHAVVPEELYPYYQDVYDHVLRVSEASDSLRDLVGTIVETNLSLRDYRQNLIVKKVSSWAAIIAVPALITGYYGMNLPYPGSGETWGVVAATVLMVAVSGGLYFLFKRRDWL
jgi:magnesium transporter